MAYPEYEELSSKDKDTFTSVCNRLLAETFVLRTLVKPGGETINNPEYSFLSRNFSLVRDYLSLIDWELVRDDFNGFFYVRNAAQANKLVFNKMATGILLALRLLYEENEGRLGLAQDLECSWRRWSPTTAYSASAPISATSGPACGRWTRTT